LASHTVISCPAPRAEASDRGRFHETLLWNLLAIVVRLAAFVARRARAADERQLISGTRNVALFDDAIAERIAIFVRHLAGDLAGPAAIAADEPRAPFHRLLFSCSRKDRPDVDWDVFELRDHALHLRRRFPIFLEQRIRAIEVAFGLDCQQLCAE